MTVSALRATAYLRRHGGATDRRWAVLDRAVEAGRERAGRNPRANRRPVRMVPAPYPLRLAELQVETDAVAAVVLRRADSPRPGGLRIAGVGHTTESFHLGDRLLSELPSARSAAGHALGQADRGLDGVDVVEVTGRTVWDEAQLLESVGPADPGCGFGALADDRRLNPSGGSSAGDCEPASGLVRFAEAALQLTGRAGGVQVPGTPRVALAVSGAALAGQTHTAVVSTMSREAVGIVGVGQTPYRRSNPGLSAAELVRIAADEALADGGVGMDAIGAAFGGVAPDGLSGIKDIDPVSVSVPGRPYFRINTGGATGASVVQVAMAWIGACRADTVLAVALERIGQATTAQAVFNTIFDPIYEKDFALTTITMAALRASMLVKRHGFSGRHWAGMASRNFTNATTTRW